MAIRASFRRLNSLASNALLLAKSRIAGSVGSETSVSRSSTCFNHFDMPCLARPSASTCTAPWMWSGLRRGVPASQWNLSTLLTPINFDASPSQLEPRAASRASSLQALECSNRVAVGQEANHESSPVCLPSRSFPRYFSTKSSKRHPPSKDSHPSSSHQRASPEQRQARLEAGIREIESKYGKGSVFTFGSAPEVLDVQTVSTGSLGLDAALGTGGLPMGRVVEIYGQEASGKTTLALHVVAEAQKLGGICIFVDAENTLNPPLASAIGVDMRSLCISQPQSGEEALGIVDELVRSGGADVIVVDSVSALVPKAELEGEMGDPHMALQARLMGQGLRKITASLARSKTMVIFINQIRNTLNTFGGFGGPSETTSGGKALKFFTTVRLQIKKLQQLKTGDKVQGYRVEVKVTKNKLAPPFRTATFDIDFGRGISKEGELLDLAMAATSKEASEPIVTKSGAWLSYRGTYLGQGRENAKLFLRENKEMFEEIARELRGVPVASGELGVDTTEGVSGNGEEEEEGSGEGDSSKLTETAVA